MATKKAASTAKKTTNRPAAKKQSSTKVTTVKAVESRPVHRTETTPTNTASRRLGAIRTPLVAALVAEFLATFVFAAVVIAGQGQPILVMFALVGVVLATASISGGYANPALVIGSWITKRISGLRALAYIVAQILGAMLALVLLNAFVHAAPAASNAASDMYNAAPQLFHAAVIPKGHEWFIVLSELVGTLIFGFAVANALRERADRTAAAFTVGLGVFLGLMVAGSAAAFLGASAILNPAVAISLQAIDFSSVWPLLVYVIAPIIGAVIGFALHDFLRNAEVTERVA